MANEEEEAKGKAMGGYQCVRCKFPCLLYTSDAADE